MNVKLKIVSYVFGHQILIDNVMLKILQARLQQYGIHELPDVQAGFRKCRGTRDHSQHLLEHGKSKRVPEKHLFLLY